MLKVMVPRLSNALFVVEEVEELPKAILVAARQPANPASNLIYVPGAPEARSENPDVEVYVKMGCLPEKLRLLVRDIVGRQRLTDEEIETEVAKFKDEQKGEAS